MTKEEPVSKFDPRPLPNAAQMQREQELLRATVSKVIAEMKIRQWCVEQAVKMQCNISGDVLPPMLKTTAEVKNPAYIPNINETYFEEPCSSIEYTSVMIAKQLTEYFYDFVTKQENTNE